MPPPTLRDSARANSSRTMQRCAVTSAGLGATWRTRQAAGSALVRWHLDENAKISESAQSDCLPKCRSTEPSVPSDDAVTLDTPSSLRRASSVPWPRCGEYECGAALDSGVNADIRASATRVRPDAGTRVDLSSRVGPDVGSSVTFRKMRSLVGCLLDGKRILCDAVGQGRIERSWVSREPSSCSRSSTFVSHLGWLP